MQQDEGPAGGRAGAGAAEEAASRGHGQAAAADTEPGAGPEDREARGHGGEVRATLRSFSALVEQCDGCDASPW